MHQFLPHEKLDTYARALEFAGLAVALVDSWPPKLAVRGQLDRAMESMLTNLALAARHQHMELGVHQLACSLGSVLESAACLDVALHRKLLDEARLEQGKGMLRAIAGMEVALRRSWSAASSVRDDDEHDDHDTHSGFRHESLAVYQRSMQIHTFIATHVESSRGGWPRCLARIDELSTSLTLNIAEGNGRFSNLDHGAFIQIAEDAATKLAAYLDLAGATMDMDVEPVKGDLREIMAMLAGLRGYLKS